MATRGNVTTGTPLFGDSLAGSPGATCRMEISGASGGRIGPEPLPTPRPGQVGVWIVLSVEDAVRLGLVERPTP